MVLGGGEKWEAAQQYDSTQEVITKARFRRILLDGQSSSTMLSLHCHSAVVKKRSRAQDIFSADRTAMIEADVDLVAGDINGASWNEGVPKRRALLLFGAPGGIPRGWTDVCGFVQVAGWRYSLFFFSLATQPRAEPRGIPKPSGNANQKKPAETPKPRAEPPRIPKHSGNANHNHEQNHQNHEQKR